MSKFKFVVVSKDENFKMPLENFIQYGLTGYLVHNNTESLAKVYNHYLNEFRYNCKDCVDFIVFMHADVQVDVKSFLSHVEQCRNKYDVIGLCGTSVMNVSQSPLNWYTGSNPTPNTRWGCVTHGEIGNQTAFFSSHSPDVTDHEVACIDGLCIVFGPKAIESGMKFDEQFKYDFYDTDISFQTILNYKLKLGVVVEKSLQHFSVGRSILTKDFLQHEIDFRKKWKLEVPANSPIRNICQADQKST